MLKVVVEVIMGLALVKVIASAAVSVTEVFLVDTRIFSMAAPQAQESSSQR